MSAPSIPARRTAPADWRLTPWTARVLLVAVAVLLALPGLGTLAGIDREVQRDDARASAAATGLAGRLAEASYTFDGHFAFRASLVRWQADLRYRLFAVSPLPTVIRGRDGWWFYGDDGAIEDATNAAPFPEAELVAWRDTLQHTTDWLHARGIAYVFVLVPDKHTVYPQYLPASLHRRAGPSRVDQLVAYLRAHSTVPVLDLRDTLVAATSAQRIYHRTDSHWNDIGAAIGYRATLEALAPPVPSMPPPHGADAFTIVPREEPGWDLAEMMGLTHVLTETDLTLAPRQPRRARIVEPANPHPLYIGPRLVAEQDDAALPRAVFYRDSFGSALVPFLAEHFQRTVVLWEYDVQPSTIREEHPQVVIQEWAGRRLHNRAPFDAIIEDAAAAAEIGISSSAPARR